MKKCFFKIINKRHNKNILLVYILQSYCFKKISIPEINQKYGTEGFNLIIHFIFLTIIK